MSSERANNKKEIVEVSKDISVGDKLLVNNRSRYLKVVNNYDFYKDNHEIKEFFILEGNGTNYLFVVYRSTCPLIYTDSNFSVEEKDYTNGYGFSTSTKSSERVRRLFASSFDHCDDCNCSKLYDSIENNFYCPKCEV